jgi:hypothetical protein
MINYEFIFNKDYNYMSYGENCCITKNTPFCKVDEYSYKEILKAGYLIKNHGFNVNEYITLDYFDIYKITTTQTNKIEKMT